MWCVLYLFCLVFVSVEVNASYRDNFSVFKIQSVTEQNRIATKTTEMQNDDWADAFIDEVPVWIINTQYKVRFANNQEYEFKMNVKASDDSELLDLFAKQWISIGDELIWVQSDRIAPSFYKIIRKGKEIARLE